MKLRALFCALLACVGLSLHRSAAQAQGIPCSYEIAAVIQAPDCPFTGANPTAALGISPSGRYVCGVHGQCDKFGEAFVYDMQTGVFLTIPRPPGILGARANDVNDTGLVAGTADSPTGGFIGFVYDVQSGNWTNLPAINGAAGHSFASGVNNAGTVCGSRSIGSNGNPLNPRTAFTWSAKAGGTFSDLGLIDGSSSGASDISEEGNVTVTKDFGLAAYVWAGRGITNIGWLPGADDIRPNAICLGAHVVGGSLFIDGSNSWLVPIEYRDGSLRTLPVLSDTLRSCSPEAVNPSGLIVGNCRPINAGNDMHAVSWLGTEIRELQPLLTGGSGLTLRNAAAMSDGGLIACNAYNPNNITLSLVLAPVAGIVGDSNCDGLVNIDDLLKVIQWWGPGASYGDLNGDQIVNLLDLLMVIDNWSF